MSDFQQLVRERMAELVELVRENRRAAAAIGIVIVLLVLLLATRGGDDDRDELVLPDRRPTPTTEPAFRLVGDVDPVDCNTLLYDEDIELALGLEEGWTGSGPLHVSKGETCTATLEDESFLVIIQPGKPGDFADDATLLGVPGEPVSGVGDDARWFGGPDATRAGDVGGLSVHASADLGALYFRIVLGRPDLEPEEQQDLAIELASRALPRFPGMGPATVRSELEPPDPAGASYGRNVLAKEADGEWTLGEGLVATLRMLLGEVEPSEVLREDEPADQSAVELIGMAQQYVEDGPDSSRADEIEALLDRLLLSRAQLEGMAGETASAASSFSAAALPSGAGAAIRPSAPAPNAPRAAQTAEDHAQCQEMWNTDAHCFKLVTSPALDPNQYSIWFPRQSVPDKKGWNATHETWALKAMEKSAAEYSKLGMMPKQVSIVFTSETSGYPTYVDTAGGGDACFVLLRTGLQSKSSAEFQQRIAFTMAYCMIMATFDTSITSLEWWAGGLALWLSTEPYPSANSEWGKPKSLLEGQELSTSLTDRTVSNWAFFEFTEDVVGPQGNIEMISSLPPLASVPGIAPMLHQFALALTDADIPDEPPPVIPYDPPRETVEVAGTTILEAIAGRFGTVRYHLQVEPGKVACLDYVQHQDAQLSWRTGAPADGSTGWSPEPTAWVDDDVVFVVTSTEQGGGFEIEVTGLEDDPDDCDEPGGGGAGLGETQPCSLDCGPSEFYYEE